VAVSFIGGGNRNTVFLALPRELDQEEKLGKGIRYSVIVTPPCE
jgi:hypothetical protein